jgi:hypothetical protein
MLTGRPNARLVTALAVLLACVCLTLLLIGPAVLVLPRSRQASAFRAMGILRQVVEVLVSGRRASGAHRTSRVTAAPGRRGRRAASLRVGA